jgi:hypothetical protein
MQYNLKSLSIFALFSIYSTAGFYPVTAADELKTDSSIQIFKSEVNVICKPFRIPDSSIRSIYFSTPPEPDCSDTIIGGKTKDIINFYKIREGLFIARNMNSVPTVIKLYTSMSDNDSIIYKLKSVGFKDKNDNYHRTRLKYKSIYIEDDIAESPWILKCIKIIFKDEVIGWKIYIPL